MDTGRHTERQRFQHVHEHDAGRFDALVQRRNITAWKTTCCPDLIAGEVVQSSANQARSGTEREREMVWK